MTREAEALSDYRTLGDKLADAVGSEAAAIVRERRLLAERLDVDRAADMRSDYERLGRLLGKADATAAAAIARERRLIAAELDVIELPEETPFVDRLAAQRADPGRRRPPARRRKSR